MSGVGRRVSGITPRHPSRDTRHWRPFATGADNSPTVTALSCLAIGLAFVLAVALLVFAGVMLGWVIPALIERARRQRDAPPPNNS